MSNITDIFNNIYSNIADSTSPFKVNESSLTRSIQFVDFLCNTSLKVPHV